MKKLSLAIVLALGVGSTAFAAAAPVITEAPADVTFAAPRSGPDRGAIKCQRIRGRVLCRVPA